MTFLAYKHFAGRGLTPHNFYVTNTDKACGRSGRSACPLQITPVQMGQPPSSGTWRPFHLPETRPLAFCPGFSWNKVNFLHSNEFSTAFWL